jgi:hypothetical protein
LLGTSNELLNLREEGGERWEINNVAGERMEYANRGVVVSLQDEEAIERIESAVVLEQRDVDADEGSCVEVEEVDVAVQLGVARVEAPALGQHHPAPRMEAWVDDAAASRGRSAGSPSGANSTKADVVQQVAGQ